MLGEDMGILDKELFAGKPKQFNYDEVKFSQFQAQHMFSFGAGDNL